MMVDVGFYTLILDFLSFYFLYNVNIINIKQMILITYLFRINKNYIFAKKIY